MANPFLYVVNMMKRDTVRDVKDIFTQPDYIVDSPEGLAEGQAFWNLVTTGIDSDELYNDDPFIPGHPHPFRDMWHSVRKAARKLGSALNLGTVTESVTGESQ